PWNKFAVAARQTRLAAAPGAQSPPLTELLALDEARFRARFAGTPLRRTGRNRVVRNALIAAGNSGDARLVPALQPLLAGGSSLVRAMAVWALRRLLPEAAFRRLRSTRLGSETDASVLAEWDSY